MCLSPNFTKGKRENNCVDDPSAFAVPLNSEEALCVYGIASNSSADCFSERVFTRISKYRKLIEAISKFKAIGAVSLSNNINQSSKHGDLQPGSSLDYDVNQSNGSTQVFDDEINENESSVPGTDDYHDEHNSSDNVTALPHYYSLGSIMFQLLIY